MKSHRPPLPAFARLLSLRHDAIADALDLNDPEEIGAAISDLDYFLTLAWTFLRDVDRNASIPRQRIELKRLLRSPRFDAATMHSLDPALANRIGCYLDGGTLRLLYGRPAPKEILDAARRALRQFPHRKRGRPADTGSLAFRQLALGLATVWRDHTGKIPTRSYSQAKGGEFGPFRDFVELVAMVIPAFIGALPQAPAPQVDHLVRTAIAEFHAAARLRDPNRLRGHIDEAAWLRAPKVVPRKRKPGKGRRDKQTRPLRMRLGLW